MRHRLRIVEASEIVALVTARSKVHAGRESAIRVSLSILPMAPLYFEALLIGIVGHAFITCLCILITGIEATTITIAFAIVGGGAESP